MTDVFESESPTSADNIHSIFRMGLIISLGVVILLTLSVGLWEAQKNYHDQHSTDLSLTATRLDCTTHFTEPSPMLVPVNDAVIATTVSAAYDCTEFAGAAPVFADRLSPGSPAWLNNPMTFADEHLILTPSQTFTCQMHVITGPYWFGLTGDTREVKWVCRI